MNDDTLTVLLISDDATDARLIRKALAGPTDSEWRLEQVRRLSDGVIRLRKEGIAAVLLDLFLPDSQGIKTIEALFEAAPLVPILVLADRENEAIAWQATTRGAQDHLLKDHLDGYWLPRILRSVIERKAGEEALFMEKEPQPPLQVRRQKPPLPPASADDRLRRRMTHFPRYVRQRTE